MKFGLRITLIAILPILLTAVVAAAVALYQKGSLQNFFASEIERQARSEAQKITRDVYLMCRAAQEALQQTVNNNLRVAGFVLDQTGDVTFADETVHWQARNQYTSEQQSMVLPRMLAGGTWLGQNRNFADTTPVVDSIRELVGGTVTIFQRMNSRGDMLRVATNVSDVDGRRAIGTFIPAIGPEGTPDPVVDALLRGESFQGRAYVVNAWYVTAYHPLWDESGRKVIGALYVGVRQENLESLRKGIMDIVVGKSGYVYILGGKGRHRGQYVISQDGRRDGENIWNSTDARGHFFIREIITQALREAEANPAAPIPVSFVRYPWRNPGEDRPREKIVAVTYFEPWDWVIGAGYYESDLQGSQYRLQTAMNRMGYWTGLTAMLMILFAVPAGYLVAGGIRNRIDSILTSVEEILIVIDNHGRILLLSQSAAEFLGVTLKQANGKPFERFIGIEDLREKVKKSLRERHRGARFDFEVPTAKSIRIMEARTSAIQARTGGISGMIFIIHDVTGEREVDRLKSEFICTAAHELSTPLASIIGYSELLLENRDLSVETYGDAATYINKKAWSLSRIVNDLLDLSRIELGRDIPIEKKPCDINEALREVVNFGRNLTNRHAFSLSLPEEPVVIACDRMKIDQALENILSNAIKYSPEGGTISIVGAPKIAAYQIMVEDQGIGMTRAQAAHIFEKFYRVDNSTTAVEGTGLGMSIVQHIIDGHGGKVWVESEPGKGARVYVELPWDSVPIDRGSELMQEESPR